MHSTLLLRAFRRRLPFSLLALITFLVSISLSLTFPQELTSHASIPQKAAIAQNFVNQASELALQYRRRQEIGDRK